MARKVKVDLTGVESYLRASEGVHVCKIASADMKASSSGNDMIVIAYEVTKGDDKGARVFENYPLVETALWKLKALLQAIGMKADGKVQLDLDKLIGKVVQVQVKHEEYEGKIRARVDSVMKLAGATSEESDDEDEDLPYNDDDDDDEQEEEEKPVKKSKATEGKKKAPMNPPEEDDDDDDEDWDDEDEDEEEEPAPKKSNKPAKKADKKPAKKAEPEEDDDEDADDDDDWDEE